MDGASRHLPNWAVLIIDLFIVALSFVGSYNLRYNFAVPDPVYADLAYLVPYVLIVRGAFFVGFRTFAGVIRYTSSADAVRIFAAACSGSLVFVIGNIISVQVTGKHLIPYGIMTMEFVLSTFLMTGMRLSYRVLYNRFARNRSESRSVIIYGAGEAGLITKKTLDRDVGTKYRIKAFVDDNPNLHGKRIEGIDVYLRSRKLRSLIEGGDVDQVIVSAQSISGKRLAEVVDLCLPFKVKVLHVPPPSRWINGELTYKQIRRVRIEELLGREPIRLDEASIHGHLAGKTVLVTGAAGSIGSELVRQMIKYSPRKVIMLDQAESPLFRLETEINAIRKVTDCEAVIADVRNEDRMENAFRSFKPQIVFHAAAYKHVPMMENNPSEAVLANVLGTEVVADLADRFKVQQFVLVSTDKAVNPSNVMGASKRVAEIYCQALDRKSNTEFVTTRFGNVLGSTGSVIRLFRKQIEERQPITVTHPDVTRYFMTIPEACQLVLEAGAIGHGGEILIFDMGESVRIIDLAKKMVELSGLELGKDIQIVFTGLREGEKLYEELLNVAEDVKPTHHPNIMIAKVREYEFSQISNDITELIGLFDSQNNDLIVSKLKEIVPEFISSNSPFEKLDVKKARVPQ
jgi:FlaA1/EpsC-like NDP-sugar epimerase